MRVYCCVIITIKFNWTSCDLNEGRLDVNRNLKNEDITKGVDRWFVITCFFRCVTRAYSRALVNTRRCCFPGLNERPSSHSWAISKNWGPGLLKCTSSCEAINDHKWLLVLSPYSVLIFLSYAWQSGGKFDPHWRWTTQGCQIRHSAASALEGGVQVLHGVISLICGRW